MDLLDLDFKRATITQLRMEGRQSKDMAAVEYFGFAYCDEHHKVQDYHDLL